MKVPRDGGPAWFVFFDPRFWNSGPTTVPNFAHFQFETRSPRPGLEVSRFASRNRVVGQPEASSANGRERCERTAAQSISTRQHGSCRQLQCKRLGKLAAAFVASL